MGTTTIVPTTPADLAELGRFLESGFGAPPGSPFARPDVLSWKYFDPQAGSVVPRSYLARDESGRIVGHVGASITAFRDARDPSFDVPTLHMMDWLRAEGVKRVGASLMLKMESSVPTQYVLGGSEDARTVLSGHGYQSRNPVTLYIRPLRPIVGRSNAGGWKTIARAGRDAWRTVCACLKRPRSTVELQPLDRFGYEVETVLNECRLPILFTRRTPDLLNHRLRCPAARCRAYAILAGTRTVGFAMTSIPEGPSKLGRIAELFLVDDDPIRWASAFDQLAGELRQDGAVSVSAYGSTPWTRTALERAGFFRVDDLEFRIRDRNSLLPEAASFHLMPLEADYVFI